MVVAAARLVRLIGGGGRMGRVVAVRRGVASMWRWPKTASTSWAKTSARMAGVSPLGASWKWTERCRHATRSEPAAIARRSCETVMMVMPSSACSLLMRSAKRCCPAASTPTVGSSRTSSLGRVAMARAIMARCSWPPESAPIGRSARSDMATNASASSAARSAARSRSVKRPARSASGIATACRTEIGKSSSAVSRWGRYPTSPRRRASAGVVPSTVIDPASGSSSPRMILTRVDFPPPFGPSTPSREPPGTDIVMSRSAWTG